MAAKELWVEAYRPTTLDGYVFRDSHQKQMIEKWISDGSIPHVLLSGSSGIGKTTLAKILINKLDIHQFDVLEINASRTNSVDDVRNKIINFIEKIPFGAFKVVLLDEADYLSHSAQAALRGILEEYHEYARFILTCNYPNKILPAIHSRCQGFHIEEVDQVEFTTRVATILLTESIQFDLETLDIFVKATYPDLRKCINLVQMNSLAGSLLTPNAGDSNDADYKLEMVQLFKAGKISDARKLICKQVRPDEIGDIYRWLYSNIDYFGNTVHKQDDAVLIIKQGLVDHSLVIDPEINLAAVLIRLARNLEE